MREGALATDLVSGEETARGAAGMGKAGVRPVNRAGERVFFCGMAVLLSLVVVFGFGRLYFFAGMMRAPLPNLLVHVHAAVFTVWILLYGTQTALVAADRVRWHRTLGLAAFFLAAGMVPLGIVTSLDELRRENTPFTGVVPAQSLSFLAQSLLGIGLFAVVILASWRARRRPGAHKRLAVYATIGLASGGLVRMHWRAMGLPPSSYLWALGVLVGLVVVFDLVTLGRVHRSSMWAAPLTFATIAANEVVAGSAWWQGFASFLVRHVVAHL